MEKSVTNKRIREVRRERGYTLATLARLTGFTKGYLSRIENSDGPPRLSTLHKIAAALGVDPTFLVANQESDFSDSQITIVRKKDRQELNSGTTDSAFKITPLAMAKLGRNMEPYIAEIPFETDKIYQHEGEDFYLVLEGKALFIYGGKEFTFSAGDAIYFDGNVPHTGRSIGTRKARVLIVMYTYKKIQTPPFFNNVMSPEKKR